MRACVALLMLPICASYLLTSSDDLDANHDYSFTDYTEEYGKSYSTFEHSAREAIFLKNLAKIRAHNAQKRSFRMGLNHFTDWNETEVSQRMTGGMSATLIPPVAMHELPKGFTLADLPASMDWRNATPSVVTPIKEQGLCGSCWAFAATEAIESAAAIATGKLQVLAPQQLVSCAPNPNQCGGTGGCSGATPSVGFNYTMGVGLSLEMSYPYNHQETPCNASAIRPAVGIKGFVDIPNNNATLLMHALTQGPVTVSVAANWAAYERGVFDGPHGTPCGYNVNHAVVIVGYGHDAALGLNYWIIRNSWTPTWGEHGYMRILRAADNAEEPCGIDENPQNGVACKGDTKPKKYCGTCGLLSLSSYPTGSFNMKP